LTAFTIYIFVFLRQSQLKKRVEDLLVISESQSKKINANQILTKTTKKIPENIKNEIVDGLIKFENKSLFTNPRMTLTGLAEILNTNTNYLSHVVNSEKGKNFTSYLNDLRIEFAIEAIKNNEVFRNYKVSAIAKECGFNKKKYWFET